MTKTSMSKPKGIILKPDEVRSLLDTGRVVVWREIKPQPEFGVERCHFSKTGWGLQNDRGTCDCKPAKCPFGKVGDVKWVKESWCGPMLSSTKSGELYDHVGYRASSRLPRCYRGHLLSWLDPKYMPKKYSRLNVLLESVTPSQREGKWGFAGEFKRVEGGGAK